MVSSIGSGSGETSITASPISFTSFTGGSHDLVGQPRQPAGDAAELLDRHALAELGEADQVGERDHGLLRVVELAGAALLLRQRVAAQDLLEVEREDVLEPRAGERHQLLGDRAVAVRELVLVEARLDERARDQRARRLGVARHPLTEHARDLERVLVVEAGLPVGGAELRRLEVLLAVDALVGGRDRQAERAPAGGQEGELDAGLLGDLARRVARLGAERAGDRREHELVLGHDPAQLLDVHALLVQLVEQAAARVARGVVLEAFE